MLYPKSVDFQLKAQSSRLLKKSSTANSLSSMVKNP